MLERLLFKSPQSPALVAEVDLHLSPSLGSQDCRIHGRQVDSSSPKVALEGEIGPPHTTSDADT